MALSITPIMVTYKDTMVQGWHGGASRALNGRLECRATAEHQFSTILGSEALPTVLRPWTMSGLFV